MMKRFMVLVLVFNVCGCAHEGMRKRSLWEVQLSLGYEKKLEDGSKVNGGLVLKRPISVVK